MNTIQILVKTLPSTCFEPHSKRHKSSEETSSSLLPTWVGVASHCDPVLIPDFPMSGYIHMTTTSIALDCSEFNFNPENTTAFVHFQEFQDMPCMLLTLNEQLFAYKTVHESDKLIYLLDKGHQYGYSKSKCNIVIKHSNFIELEFLIHLKRELLQSSSVDYIAQAFLKSLFNFLDQKVVQDFPLNLEYLVPKEYPPFGTDFIQPQRLKPQLYPFQTRSLSWMLNRERISFESMDSAKLKVSSFPPTVLWERRNTMTGSTFYYNSITGAIRRHNPESEVLGGYEFLILIF